MVVLEREDSKLGEVACGSTLQAINGRIRSDAQTLEHYGTCQPCNDLRLSALHGGSNPQSDRVDFARTC